MDIIIPILSFAAGAVAGGYSIETQFEHSEGCFWVKCVELVK